MNSDDQNWNNKQIWIKDVLSKSGTDILEIKTSKPKDNSKMVYYPSLPLIMKSEQKSQQFCTKLGNGEKHLFVQPSAISANGITTGSGLANGTLLITSNNPGGTVKIEKNHDHSNGGANEQHHFQNSNVQCQPNNGRVSTSASITSQTNSRSTVQGPSTTPTKPQFRCDQCNMIFGSKSAHTSHIKSHLKNQESNYSLVANSNSNLTMASTSTTPSTQMPPTNGNNSGDPYRCDVCQKTFAVPARLIRHYRTHTGERPFKCEFCDKMFSVKENLQVHRRIHTKERPYKCDVCGRAFEHSGKLHRHMRIHTGERPHKCSVCGKTFIQSGQLVIHMRTHTGEKPYKCPVEGCGKGFTCSKQLKVHSRTHTGEKPYHCDICSRDFGYNHVLKLHRVQHYGSKCYKCTICDETFKSKKEMEAHIKGHANEIPDDDEEQQQQHQHQQQKQIDQSSPSPSPSIDPQSPLTENLQQIDSQIQLHMPSSIKQETNNSNKFKETLILLSPQASSSSVSSFILETDSGIANTIQNTAGSIPLDMTTNEQRTNCEILEAHSDEEIMYSNIYHRYQSQMSPNPTSYNVQSNNGHPTINPALLAAASIASRKVVEEANNALRELSSSSAISSESNDNSRDAHEMSLSEYYKSTGGGNSSDGIAVHLESSPEHFEIESLEVLRKKGFFTPAVPVAEYRSTLHHSDIVRQVEAAIAGAGLSPPRSISTESPDRSSSPESDTMLMADRDVMTLPLRKRKLYLNDNNQPKDGAQTMRMSSVIQFAKAKGVS